MKTSSRNKKEHEPVRLRRKKLTGGRESLYLDIYTGNGKRQYEFLDLPKLEAETNNSIRRRNLAIVQRAEAIVAERIQQIEREGGIQRGVNRVPLLEYAEKVRAKHTGGTVKNYGIIIKHLRAYLEKYYTRVSPDRFRLTSVDVNFAEGFLSYLREEADSGTGNRLSPGTVRAYYIRFGGIFSQAVKDQLLIASPVKQYLMSIDGLRKVETERAYLTEGEVKRLAAAPCKYPDLKRAFLFSCMCGLRISDVRALTWGQITEDGGEKYAEVKMIKTQKIIYVPFNDTAAALLPERGDKGPEEKVFALPTELTVSRALNAWVKAAGIAKHITFHCARHTFATLAITKGVDIYAVMGLLGHTSVATTQIYAKLIDKKKKEAAKAVAIDLGLTL